MCTRKALRNCDGSKVLTLPSLQLRYCVITHRRKRALSNANSITGSEPEQGEPIAVIACSSPVDLRGSVRITKRTRITAETERVLIVRRRGIEAQGWCEGCGEQVKLVTPQTAGTVIGVKVRTICRMVESNNLHFSETPNGSLLICLNSLFQRE